MSFGVLPSKQVSECDRIERAESKSSTGVLVAVGLTRTLQTFAGWSETLGPLGSFIVTAPVIVQGVFLSLFVGMLAGLVPSYGAARKPVVEALHEVF